MAIEVMPGQFNADINGMFDNPTPSCLPFGGTFVGGQLLAPVPVPVPVAAGWLAGVAGVERWRSRNLRRLRR
jgi:hypothetical protein